MNELPFHSPSSIAADSVSLSFADQAALHNVSFHIPAGHFVSIVGPSGCGKTSLLRIIAGLQAPTSGSLDVQSSGPRGATNGGPDVGYVFQTPALLPWRTVLENVRLPMQLRGMTSDQEARARETLRKVGLTPDDDPKFPRMLSGGMQMRVSLARALVVQPGLMLFDEPFAALDDLLRQRLNEELLQLWQAAGWTGVFVTHNVSEAVYLSQQVMVMTDRPGQIHRQIDIPFGYPRTPDLRAASQFASLTGQISDIMRQLVRI